MEIKYTRNASNYLKHLVKTLFSSKYFAIEDNANQYIEDIIFFIESNIEKQQHKIAPPVFDKFGKNLKYISYKRSKRTTWYVFFVELNNNFIIKHITNNHVSAQYFGK